LADSVLLGVEEVTLIALGHCSGLSQSSVVVVGGLPMNSVRCNGGTSIAGAIKPSQTKRVGVLA
jgi:hypothetical protein